MSEKRINLFGIFIDDLSLDEAMEKVHTALSGKGAISVFTPNLEILDGARRSDGAKSMLNTADLSLPDGTGLRIVSALLGKTIKNTTPGIDFGEELLCLCAKEKKRVFLLGGREGVAEKAAENLRKKLPSLIICGTRDGYFHKNEIQNVCDGINASRAEVLIVCRGFPRQESFVCEAKQYLSEIKIFACLGGSLDVWAEEVKRAPLPLRRAHLEWLWRISQEPERIERFLYSLRTLFEALYVFLINIPRRIGIFEDNEAYNQVSKKSKP